MMKKIILIFVLVIKNYLNYNRFLQWTIPEADETYVHQDKIDNELLTRYTYVKTALKLKNYNAYLSPNYTTDCRNKLFDGTCKQSCGPASINYNDNSILQFIIKQSFIANTNTPANYACIQSNDIMDSVNQKYIYLGFRVPHACTADLGVVDAYPYLVQMGQNCQDIALCLDKSTQTNGKVYTKLVLKNVLRDLRTWVFSFDDPSLANCYLYIPIDSIPTNSNQSFSTFKLVYHEIYKTFYQFVKNPAPTFFNFPYCTYIGPNGQCFVEYTPNESRNRGKDIIIEYNYYLATNGTYVRHKDLLKYGIETGSGALAKATKVQFDPKAGMTQVTEDHIMTLSNLYFNLNYKENGKIIGDKWLINWKRTGEPLMSAYSIPNSIVNCPIGESKYFIFEPCKGAPKGMEKISYDSMFKIRGDCLDDVVKGKDYFLMKEGSPFFRSIGQDAEFCFRIFVSSLNIPSS